MQSLEAPNKWLLGYTQVSCPPGWIFSHCFITARYPFLFISDHNRKSLLAQGQGKNQNRDFFKGRCYLFSGNHWSGALIMNLRGKGQHSNPLFYTHLAHYQNRAHWTVAFQGCSASWIDNHLQKLHFLGVLPNCILIAWMTSSRIGTIDKKCLKLYNDTS